MSTGEASLGQVATRGGGVTVVGQLAKMTIQFGSLVILSRLLPPEAFGLVAMTAVFMGIGELLRDFGLSLAAMQAQTLSHAQKSNLFWLSSSIGVLLAIIAGGLAQPVSSVYGEPAVRVIVLALAPVLVLNALQTQFQVELARSMRFGALVLTDIAAQVIGLVLAVGAAIAGAGYWALVSQMIGVSTALLLGRVAASGWRPGRPDFRTNIATFARYGGALSGAQLIGYVASNVDNLVIGARYGAESVGVYARAFQLLTIPVNQMLIPLTNVVIPTLKELVTDLARYWRTMERLQTAIGLTLIPAFFTAAALSGPLVSVALGPQWHRVAPIFTALAVGGVFQLLTFVGYWVFLSKGITASLLRYNVATKSATVGLVLLGSRWNAEGVAIAYAGSLIISWPFCLYWLHKKVQLPGVQFLKAGVRCLALGVTCGLTAALVAWLFRDMSDAPALAAGCVAAAASYCLVMLLSQRLRSELSSYYRMVRASYVKRP